MLLYTIPGVFLAFGTERIHVSLDTLSLELLPSPSNCVSRFRLHTLNLGLFLENKKPIETLESWCSLEVAGGCHSSISLLLEEGRILADQVQGQSHVDGDPKHLRANDVQ